jgi:hypothetical protein
MAFKYSISRLMITILGFLFLTACGGGGGGGGAATSSLTVTKTTTLTLAAEVPASTAPQAANIINGTASVTVDTSTNAITGTMTITGDSGRVTFAHIHDGDVGVAGPVVIPLQDNGNGNWVVAAGSVLTAAQMARFNAGGYYVNAHTVLNLGGEIRGQLN